MLGRANHYILTLFVALLATLSPAGNAQAQLVDVNDTTLQNILCTRFPGAMVNGCTQIDLDQRFLINANLNLDGDSVRDISPLLELDHIVWLEADDNLFDTIPGTWEKMTSLEHLDLSFNPLTFMPDFSTLSSPNFKILKMEKLEMEQHAYPDLSGVASSLEELHLQRNKFETAPDISSYSSLQKLSIQWNNLTFSDLLPLTTHPLYDTFTVFPQKLLPTTAYPNTDIIPGNSYTLEINIDNPDAGNEYHWFRNGEFLMSTQEPVLELTNVQVADTGTYVGSVHNSSPFFSDVGDTLGTQTKSLKIAGGELDCTPIANATASVQTKCEDHEILLSTTDNDTLSFEIWPEVGGDTIIGNGALFNEVPDGNYVVHVTSPAGCDVQLENLANFISQTDCDHVISPNGDGLGDVYFIPVTGEVKIINPLGQVLAELEAPGFWDGTNSQGEIVDAGYYLIVVNDQKHVNITVER